MKLPTEEKFEEFIKRLKKKKISVPVWKGRFTKEQRDYIDKLIEEFNKRQLEIIDTLVGDDLVEKKEDE